MSAPRPTYIVAAAIAVLTASCTEHNPRYCTSNTDCTSNAYPFCDLNGDSGGIRNRCIATPFDGSVMSCTSSADCTDPKQPICKGMNCVPCGGSTGDSDCAARDSTTPVCTSGGECVTCQVDLDCPDSTPLCTSSNSCMTCEMGSAGDDACAARDDTKPRCVGGGCAQCKDDTDCPMTEPICDGSGNFCRTCLSHDECSSDVCNPDNGQCLPEAGIIYVSRDSGSDNGTCGSKMNKCATISYALTKVQGAKNTIRVEPSSGTYSGQVHISGLTVKIYGQGAEINPISSDVAALLVDSSADVMVEGLTIARAAGNGDGVNCRSSTLRLYHVTVRDNDAQGVDAGDSCALTVERSKIDSNTGGGVIVYNSDFTLRNNFITRNGNIGIGGSQFGGVRISNGGDYTQVLDFNTIADNQANSNAAGTSVFCDVTKQMTASNNIVYLSHEGVSAVYNSNCSWTYSDVEGGQAGMGNINENPMFKDVAKADYHIGPSSLCRDAADPNDTTVDVDYDGDARAEGGRSDIGADEVYGN